MLSRNSSKIKMNLEEEEIPHQDYGDFEADEALSLRDLPLSGDGDGDGDGDDEKSHSRRRSDDLLREDPFEFSSTSFSNDDNNDSAEDIIFGGKLLPYTSSNIDHQLNNTTTNDNLIRRNNQMASTHRDHRDLRPRGNFYHRRSESVGDFYSSEKDFHNHRHNLIRPSRSLDYTKLHRSSSNTAAKSPTTTKQSDRRSSTATATTTCFGNRQWSVSGRGARPRWRLLMFGMMRAPVPEMELRDMRNRLSRRIPATMFPAANGGGGWSLLRAFGCKGEANAVVTAPLGCIPHVRI
ncbi:hypothetical protein Sjap_010641 [Stephania japonica]|uniref:Uncharacterized protein n=1 Tax=Stephania japonica TaxID=461633 RepID=A0AAP0J9R7_9MAGN